jgi:hypothetical protein
VGTVEEARQSLLLAVHRYGVCVVSNPDTAHVPEPDTAHVPEPEPEPWLPRNLERLLAELRAELHYSAAATAAAGGEMAWGYADAERVLRGAHLSELNTQHHIPDWLLS